MYIYIYFFSRFWPWVAVFTSLGQHFVKRDTIVGVISANKQKLCWTVNHWMHFGWLH